MQSTLLAIWLLVAAPFPGLYILHAVRNEAGASGWASSELLPDNMMNVVLITVQPDLLPVSLLKQVKIVAFVGPDADQTACNFAAATGVSPPQ